ncbi:MAG: tripartite tricarboxylate transporter TctB family protein [Rhodocyclaceae bacterium]|nr:tripartite tricarboxylate transporter TctB family protein [Rhodocyclaceae bacterium]
MAGGQGRDRFRERAAGATFTATGLAALLLGRNYETGTLADMGPGFFPKLIGAALLVLGLLIGLRSVRFTATPATTAAWRPLFCISAALLVFAAAIDTAGLFASTAAAVVLGCRAQPDRPWRETWLLALWLAVGAGLLFKFAFGMPVPLLPLAWGRG